MKKRNVVFLNFLLILFFVSTFIDFADTINQNNQSELLKGINERVIKVETTQNSYSNSLQFFSLFITAMIAGVSILIGLYSYITNKNNVRQLVKRQKSIEKSQEFIRINQELINYKVQEFETFAENNIKYLDSIVDDLNYYHGEIFQMLAHFGYQNYLKRKVEGSVLRMFRSLSYALLYSVISLNNLKKEDSWLVDDWIRGKDEYLHLMEEEIKNQPDDFFDEKSQNGNIKYVVKSLKNSLKYSDCLDSNEIKKINNFIVLFENKFIQ